VNTTPQSETTIPQKLVDDLHRGLIGHLAVLHAIPRLTPEMLDTARLQGADLAHYETYEYVIQTNADVAVDAARTALSYAIQSYIAACMTHKLVRPEIEQHA
jgi:hypothetical protein